MNTPARTDPRGGFSLVEVIIAVVIFAVGALAMAGTTVHVVRQSTLGNVTFKRSAAVGAVVEQIRATDYNSIANGADSVGRYALSWSVTTGSRSKTIQIVSTGPGLTTTDAGPMFGTAVDTFTYKVIRP